MDFEHLAKSDAEFLELAIKDCSAMNEALIKMVLDLDRVALDEWKEKFDSKVKAMTDQTSSWIEKMGITESGLVTKQVQDYASKIRSKNEETLTRLAKSGKKTKEYLDALKVKFEATANEMIEAEKQRISGENLQVKLRILILSQGDQRMSKTKDDFIKQYLKEEEELIERFHTSVGAADKEMQKNLYQDDEEFRNFLKHELSKADFPETQFLLLVATRDKKRQEVVKAWHDLRDHDFHKVIDHVKADNARALYQLETEFKSLFGASTEQ